MSKIETSGLGQDLHDYRRCPRGSIDIDGHSRRKNARKILGEPSAGDMAQHVKRTGVGIEQLQHG